MPQNPVNNPRAFKVPDKIKNYYYRGFISIDQEMEREIAIKFFGTSKKKTTYFQKEFSAK